MTTWTRAASLFTCLGVAACAANASAPVCPPAAPLAVASAPSASPAPSTSASVASSASLTPTPPSAGSPPAPTPSADQHSPAEPPKPKRNPYAEGSVYVTTGHPAFDLRLTLGKECDEEAYKDFRCKQPGRLEILEKGTTQVRQTIQLDEVHPHFYDKSQASTGVIDGDPAVSGAYSFEDYNFDGEPDLAVVRNDWGLYRGPQYFVYLWNKQQQRLVLNKPITKLSETEILWLDPKQKTILSTWKSGCCNHVYRYFRMVNNRPVLIRKRVVRELENPAAYEDLLVNGVWKRRKLRPDEVSPD